MWNKRVKTSKFNKKVIELENYPKIVRAAHETLKREFSFHFKVLNSGNFLLSVTSLSVWIMFQSMVGDHQATEVKTVEPIFYGWSLSGHLPFKATKFGHYYVIIKTLTTKSLFRPFLLHKQSHLKNSFAKKVNILLNNLQSFRKCYQIDFCDTKTYDEMWIEIFGGQKCTPITFHLLVCGKVVWNLMLVPTY